MKFMVRSRVVWLTVLLSVSLTGCLFRSRKVTPSSSANLQSATQEELIQRINAGAEGIHTLNATVDIATSVGGEKKGHVTDYREIRGYILVRQPDMLRMIGLLPVIHSRAFDMVSDASEFKLWVPPKNKFYIGRNNVIPPGASGLLALRPRIIYDALLLEGIDPKEDIAVMENGLETVINPETRKLQKQPDYRLDVIRRGQKGWFLARKIYFSRANLQAMRQIIYDRDGTVSSDTRYSEWKQYGSLWFPSVIQTTRPVEEYEITLKLVKLVLNEPLTDEQFALAQPPGAQVEHLEDTRVSSNDAGRDAVSK